MAQEHLFLVFSNPVPGREVQYHEWYERHVRDLVQVPGFVSARRFALRDDRGQRRSEHYRHLVVYELEGDSDDAMAALRQAVADGRAEPPDSRCVLGDIYGHIYDPVGARLSSGA